MNIKTEASQQGEKEQTSFGIRFPGPMTPRNSNRTTEREKYGERKEECMIQANTSSIKEDGGSVTI